MMFGRMLRQYALLPKAFQQDLPRLPHQSRLCSSITRYRLQDLIKKNSNECENQLKNSGKFIVFHQGRPLLNLHGKGTLKEPVIINYEQVSGLFFKLCQMNEYLFMKIVLFLS